MFQSTLSEQLPCESAVADGARCTLSSRHSLLSTDSASLSLFRNVSSPWRPEEREQPLPLHKSSLSLEATIEVAAAMNVSRREAPSGWEAQSAVDVAILTLELICVALWVSIMFGYHLLRWEHTLTNYTAKTKLVCSWVLLLGDTALLAAVSLRT